VALAILVGCGRVGFDSTRDGDLTGGDGHADSPLQDDGSVPARITFLKASNTEAFDNFGTAIALSRDGSTLAVGALQEDSAATTIDGSQTDNTAPQAGAVYVFVRSGTTWVQQAYLKPANTSSQDVFGWSLAISDDGNRIVVGAPLEDGSGTGVDPPSDDVTAVFDAGAAYVFRRAGATWSQEAYLKASNTETVDDFGDAVAISGDGATIAVGAGNEDSNATGIDGNAADNNAFESGAVYVYTFSTTWQPSAYVKASNTDAGDQFGTAVALSADGTTLAVGAPQEDSAANVIGGDETNNATTEAGAVYVFTRSGTWSQQAYIKPSQIDVGDFFGSGLALSSDGSTLAVASPGNDSTVANSGTAFVFGRSGGVWSELGMLKAPNAGDGDMLRFGIAISGDNTRVLVGAAYEDSGATADPSDDSSPDCGAAYVWSSSGGSTFTFATYMKPPVSSAGDQFGSSVATSGDHRTSVVAVPFEDSGATGVNGSATDESADASGAVYVFDD
jgi:HJR/Mrr/RecB family endonuclease